LDLPSDSLLQQSENLSLRCFHGVAQFVFAKKDFVPHKQRRRSESTAAYLRAQRPLRMGHALTAVQFHSMSSKVDGSFVGALMPVLDWWR
jgi:hypothetical protein